MLVACPPNDLLLDVQQKVNTAQSGGAPVATPVFNPAPGQDGTYSSTAAFGVEITCATDGATIFYTTDNSTPTASTTEYSGPIALVGNVPTVIKAIGVKSAMKDSDMAQATFTITYPTVRYYGNGNTSGSPPSTVACPAGQTVTVADGGSLDKTNYAFADWNTAPDGSGTTYVHGSTFQIGSSSVTLYAQWRLLRMTADNGATGDGFSSDLAIGNGGQTILAGAWHKTIGSYAMQGAAYAFDKSGNDWGQTPLVATDPAGASNDYFGNAVDVAANNGTIAIGAYNKSTGQGAVYVFDRSGGTWDKKFSAAGEATSNAFGCSVALSGDGSTLAVGAFMYNSSQGAVYVYTRSGSSWAGPTKLVGSANEEFGWSVALSGDGKTLFVAADAYSSYRGRVYVFNESGGWIQDSSSPLVVSDGAAGDYFGTDLTSSSDGSTLVVGAPGENSNRGSCHVYTKSGSWTHAAELTVTGGATGDAFGTSAALSSDVTMFVIGAPGVSSSRGAAYVFTGSGSTWTQAQSLTAPDGSASDLFGGHLAASSNGNIIVVGAVNKTIGSNSNQGTAYVFTRINGTWVAQ